MDTDTDNEKDDNDNNTEKEEPVAEICGRFQEFAKCNICKTLRPWKSLPKHLSGVHGFDGHAIIDVMEFLGLSWGNTSVKKVVDKESEVEQQQQQQQQKHFNL